MSAMHSAFGSWFLSLHSHSSFEVLHQIILLHKLNTIWKGICITFGDDYFVIPTSNTRGDSDHSYFTSFPSLFVEWNNSLPLPCTQAGQCMLRCLVQSMALDQSLLVWTIKSGLSVLDMHECFTLESTAHRTLTMFGLSIIELCKSNCCFQLHSLQYQPQIKFNIYSGWIKWSAMPHFFLPYPVSDSEGNAPILSRVCGMLVNAHHGPDQDITEFIFPSAW